MRAAVPVSLAALAIAWTWPAVVTDGLVGRQPDAAGTAWFLSAAPRLAESLRDPLTGWPAGVEYGRPDSWTMIVLGALLDGASPARVHAWVGVLGVFASAWAAEGFARALGAKAPWSLVAGAAFAFGGLAGTAWLEGYTYHLADPWLPLFAWAWWRATSPDGRVVHGLAAAGAFLLTLWTTAWLGLAAVVVAVGFAAGGWRRGGMRVAPILAAAGAVAAPAWLYVARFVAFDDPGGVSVADAPWARQLPQILLDVLPAGPSIDTGGNGQSAAFPALLLALVGASPVVLRDERGWRTVALTGLAALLLTLLPRGAFGADSAVAAALARFPQRLGWAWALCGGAVAARVATELAARVGRPAWALLAIAAVEVFAVGRVPARQRVSPAEAPGAYAAASGPVLDLWPEDIGRAPSWTLRTTNTGCFYQASHGRPIADWCVQTPGESPRLRLGRWVADRLFAGDTDGVRAQLASLGFTTLAVHPDFFHPGDRARLAASLAFLDPAPAESKDGGDHVVAYAIAGAAPAEAAVAAWVAWEEGS